MNDLTTIGAATSPVLGYRWTGEAAVARRTVPPVSMLQGTGLPAGGPSLRDPERTRLPFAGICTHFGAVGTYGVLMGADSAQATVVRIPAAADQGIPPRRTPSRC